MWKIYIGIAEEISEILHSKGLYAATVQVHTRDTNLKTKEYSRTLQNPINTSILIAKQGMRLFNECYTWDLPLRSVGLRVMNLKGDNIAFQQSIFGSEKSEEQAEKIENSILEVRKKFGRQSLKRGRSFRQTNRKIRHLKTGAVFLLYSALCIMPFSSINRLVFENSS